MWTVIVILRHIVQYGNKMTGRYLSGIGAALILGGCGDVKVVDDQSSPISRVNPMTEVVEVETNVASVSQLECLRLMDPLFAETDSITDADRTTFSRATRAHLAPLNYEIKPKCENEFELSVREYKTQEIVVASRVIVDVEGDIKDASGTTLWKASYRLTENAGSVPFDPISIGIGAVSAARNSSEDSKHNAVYLAVRRLLMALPENTALTAISNESTESPANRSQMDRALELWQGDQQSEALELAESTYQSGKQAEVGYQYGLMLEASAMDVDAAKVYSETAIVQAKNDDLESALRTLRRLDRLNSTKDGKFDLELDKALTTVQAQLKPDKER